MNHSKSALIRYLTNWLLSKFKTCLLSSNSQRRQVYDFVLERDHSDTFLCAEEEVQAAIDNNILSIILSPPDASEWQAEEMDEHHHEIFGYLLAWMVMLDHFKDIVSVLTSFRKQ